MSPLAHIASGHWYEALLYVAPVVVIVGWISVKALLDRRRERRGARDAPPPAATD